MCSMEMGFCHHAISYEYSHHLPVTHFSSHICNYFLKVSFFCVPGLGNVGRGVDIFKGELKRVLVGGLPWEDLQGVLI